MRIESFPQAELPAARRRQLARLRAQAWPVEDGPVEDGPGTEHDPALAPVIMLLVSDDTLLASLAILSKDIEHLGARYSASGLSAVVTDRAHRGRGHGRLLVSAARQAIIASGSDLALFTCDPELAGFYLRAGWTLLAGTVLIGGTPADPLPSDRLAKLTFGSFFSARAVAAAGSLLGARIELYPGDRDRLW